MSKIPSHISVPPKDWSPVRKPSLNPERQKKTTDVYRDNYDAIFRRPKAEQCKCSGNCTDCKDK